MAAIPGSQPNALVRCFLVAGLTVAAAVLAIATPARAGLTYLPHHLAVETNQRYGHDCFWAPPKGMDYANLPNAEPIQKPNLYPDVGSTYFVAQYVLPEGASLTFHGEFGHQRYMSWTMFGRPGDLGQIVSADHLRDFRIKPDRGSINPFLPGKSRRGGPRDYTFHVVSGPIPAHRAPNTIYTQTTDPETRLGMSIRNYLPDRGRDGTGDAGLPRLTLNLADGSRLHGNAACGHARPDRGREHLDVPAGALEEPRRRRRPIPPTLPPPNHPYGSGSGTLCTASPGSSSMTRSSGPDLSARRQRRLSVEPRHQVSDDPDQPQVRTADDRLGQDADLPADAPVQLGLASG